MPYFLKGHPTLISSCTVFLTKDEIKQIFISYQICKVVTECITDTTDYELEGIYQGYIILE